MLATIDSSAGVAGVVARLAGAVGGLSARDAGRRAAAGHHVDTLPWLGTIHAAPYELMTSNVIRALRKLEGETD